jgi:hypothetical protein
MRMPLLAAGRLYNLLFSVSKYKIFYISNVYVFRHLLVYRLGVK